MDTESDMESDIDHTIWRSWDESPLDKPPSLLIRFLPIVSSVKPPSASDTKTTSEPEPSSLTDHGNTQKAEESTLQETGTESFFEITVPRSDFCSKESDTSGSHSDSFDIITIKIIPPSWPASYKFVFECQNVSEFKNVINNSQSTVVLIKNWSKAGSIKVKLAPHSSCTSFLKLGVLSHASAEQRTSLTVDIRSLRLQETPVKETFSWEFSYSEAGSDYQTLFTLPWSIYRLPFITNVVENYSVPGRSQSKCVAIEVDLKSEEEFRLMVEMITPEMKIIILKLTLDEGLGNLEKLKSLPQFTIKVAHLDAGRYSLDAAVLDAFLDIFPSVDEISCQAIIKDEEQLSKLVAVINGVKKCKVRLSILELDLEAFTDLEVDLVHNLNSRVLKVGELRLKFAYTDITSLTALLAKVRNFSILRLSIEKFVTNSELLPLPVFFIQRVIPVTEYIHLKEVEISNFANPIMMDDFFSLAACEEIKLKNVVLEFSSLEKLQQFSNLKSDLLLQRFSVQVDGEEGNNKLILMMSMTTKKQNVKRIADQIDKHIASESLYYFYMKKRRDKGGVITAFNYQTEKKFALKGSITAFSCESLIQFCCEWNVDQFIELDCNDLKLQCLTPHCSKCSALTALFLLFKYHEFLKLSQNVLAIHDILSVSNVSWLLKQLLEHRNMARKNEIHIVIPKLEIFIKQHEPRSCITEKLIPSLKSLRSFGIKIEELKLLVDQDDSGWSFIRLCPTEFKVNVEFKNGLKVKLPPHATKSMIIIECFAIPRIELIESISQLQVLFTSDAQTRKLPLSLLAIDLEQLNATELEISEKNLLYKVDLLDVSIAKTSCDTLNMLSERIQSLTRLNLSVEKLVEAEKETSVVPFNNLLKSSVLSPNLTFVKLSCPFNVLHIEDLFQILIDSSDTHNINELHFSQVKLAWSSRSKIKQFCENMETYTAIRSDFVFFIDNCEAIVKPFNINVNLNLLMSLTVGMECLTEGLKLIELTDFTLKDQGGEPRIEKLRLGFKQSVFSTIDIAGVISAPTFEDVSMLCKLWRVKSETIQCQNLFFKYCETATDSDLLCLLSALSNINAVGGDYLGRLLSKTSFSMTNLSYLHKFLISADILSNSRKKATVVATVLKFVIQCHESRCEFFRLQTETLSTLKQMGISFKSVLVSVETDDTNWAYVKIALTSEKHRIQFSNEVIVTFPANCTEEPKTVSIEVHPIPDEVIKRVCAWHGTEATCHVSPVVFIDQKDDTPFLEDVCLQVPYSSSDPNVCGEKLYTEAFSKRCYEQDWSLVAKENVQKSWYTLTYNSKHFSPFSAITSTIQTMCRTSDFSKPYFANCVYVTVQTSFDEHKPHNAKFDCIKVQNEIEWKDLKVTAQLECKKIGEMNKGDILLAVLTNLRVDELYNEGQPKEMLQFFCPFHISNEQEYVMTKVNREPEPQGRVTYYRNTVDDENRLFHIMYVVPNLRGVNVNPDLNVMRPEDPQRNQDGEPEENLERPLGADPPDPVDEPHLDEPEVDQVENNAEPNLDPEQNWVIGPRLNPDEAMGPEINPRELVGPGMDPDGFVRPDQLQDQDE